ncbi:MAG TPA: 50S ribosomal protein L32 [Candidatus Dojkabacteria bacterium]|nr:50S ribosomal protein L32 [Candidatus Dojkabacteria bacterium]
MGALPKRKLSKQRKNKRRSHLALQSPALGICPECKHLRPAHQFCPNCGSYKGVQVIKVK